MSEDRVSPSSYNLSELQRAYLLGEDTGTRKPSNLEDDVEETVSHLEKRIKYLVEDLAIFDNEGYLNRGTWPNAWSELTHFDREDPLYDPPFAMEGLPRKEAEYIELAIHLGHISRFLYSGFAPDFDDEKIALGLLIGLTGGWLKEDWMTDSSIQKFLDELPEEDQQAAMFSMPDATVQDDLQQLLVDIKDSTEDVTVTIDWETELRDQLSESQVMLTSSLFSHASEMVESADPPNIPPVVSEVVKEIEATDEIHQAERLAQYIHDDIIELMTTEHKRLGADAVFWAVYSNENLQNNSDVAKHVGSHKQLAAKLLKDMRGREPPWDERQLVKKDIEYIPTEYGKIVGQLLTSDDKDIEYSLPPKDEIIRVCHAHVLGLNGDEQQQLIREALKQTNITT